MRSDFSELVFYAYKLKLLKIFPSIFLVGSWLKLKLSGTLSVVMELSLKVSTLLTCITNSAIINRLPRFFLLCISLQQNLTVLPAACQNREKNIA